MVVPQTVSKSDYCFEPHIVAQRTPAIESTVTEISSGILELALSRVAN